MRTISSLLAVAALSAGLIVACGGGLGSPASSLLGEDPIPNSGDPVGSSTDPSGSSTDPTGNGSCICPVGTWNCGGAIDKTAQVSLQNGVCTLDGIATIDCSGHFTVEGYTGSVKAQGADLYACLGSTCATCKLQTVTADDSGAKDTGLPDIGIKDTSIPDMGVKDVAKEAAAVCVSSCSVNLDCQNSCPAATSGFFNCCDPNSFVCYQDTACPGP